MGPDFEGATDALAEAGELRTGGGWIIRWSPRLEDPDRDRRQQKRQQESQHHAQGPVPDRWDIDWGGGTGWGVPLQSTQPPGQAVQVRLLREDGGHHRGGMVAGEGPVPGCREHHRGGPGEHVRGRAGRLVGQLLGGQVGQGADSHGAGREALGQAGDAEIDDYRPDRPHDHIAGLEIAVDDPGPVDGIQRGQRGHR
ncbi:hypothetical protein OHA25_37030 [Nonomuraea sp. NBC_00507]